jgi:hypothetical protein
LKIIKICNYQLTGVPNIVFFIKINFLYTKYAKMIFFPVYLHFYNANTVLTSDGGILNERVKAPEAVVFLTPRYIYFYFSLNNKWS